MSVTAVSRPQAGTEPAKAELREARMLIDGNWVGSLSGATLTVENPAKRKPVATIPRGDAADVDRAVEAAARAFKTLLGICSHPNWPVGARLPDES